MKSKFVSFDLYSFFYDLVRQIPRGEVSTFGDLARALGDVKAARACGEMLFSGKLQESIPAHRVVFSDGSVGSRAPDLSTKLRQEGVNLEEGRITSFESRRFTDFRSSRPLLRMQNEQEKMRNFANQKISFDSDCVAAIDVSYSGRSGIGAMVSKCHGEKDIQFVKRDVKFPYIPGYLSYREYPFIEALCDDFKGVLLIDGNGRLHYRGMGIATFSGILLNAVTIGIAKSLLTGNLKRKYVYINGKRVGYQMNNKEIISAGYGLTLKRSVDFVSSTYGDTYPDILREAHRLCTYKAHF